MNKRIERDTTDMVVPSQKIKLIGPEGSKIFIDVEDIKIKIIRRSKIYEDSGIGEELKTKMIINAHLCSSSI